MREIKFRAWHDGKMHFVADLEFKATGISMASLVDRYGQYIYQDTKTADINFMQYIGLKDRLDNEICEGDILRIENATAKVVFWGKPPAFGLDFYHNEDEWCEDWNLSDDSERMEIIGNVYEYPELLEVKP